MIQKKKEPEIFLRARPHSIKKFELIEKYVDEWARKILGYNGRNGYSGSKGVIYIDCMSSSGLYLDVEDNFVEGSALRVARRLNKIITDYPGKKAILYFNDNEATRVKHLEEEIVKAHLNNIQVIYDQKDCNEFLLDLGLEKFERYNTLLLYDPFKAAINWEAITPFLNRWGEVIINHMVYDTNRGASQAKKTEVIERYQETYQRDIDSIININNKGELNKVVLGIIDSRTEQEKMFVASFPFFSRTNGLLYNLIHCCSNIEGMKLFKKIAWKTFGDKSSLKKTHGVKDQLMIDLDGKRDYIISTDEDCYFVEDIVRYIFDKYHERGVVQIKEIYDDLDRHPIFPSDGYKSEIKEKLRGYGAIFRKNGTVEFNE